MGHANLTALKTMAPQLRVPFQQSLVRGSGRGGSTPRSAADIAAQDAAESPGIAAALD
jgi:hypothetical protein